MQKEYFGDVISKTNIVEYTDIQGFKRIFERQNNEENVTKQSFRSKNMFKLNDENSNTTNLENNTKKHILLDDIIVNLETKQDKENGKSSMAVSVKYKETVILEFEIEDTGEMLLLHGKDFFEEYIGIEKKKIENIINWVSESGTVNLANIDTLRNMLLKVNQESKNDNMFADMEKIIEKAKEYLLKEIEELDSEKIDARTNVPTKYQGKDLKVDNITITLKKQEYKDILTRVYNKTLYYIQKNKSEFQSFDMLSSIFSTKEEKTKADTIKLNNSITLNNTGTKTMTSVDNEKSQTQNNQNSGDNSNNKNSQNNDSQSKENNNNSGNNNNGGNNSGGNNSGRYTPNGSNNNGNNNGRNNNGNGNNGGTTNQYIYNGRVLTGDPNNNSTNIFNSRNVPGTNNNNPSGRGIGLTGINGNNGGTNGTTIPKVDKDLPKSGESNIKAVIGIFAISILCGVMYIYQNKLRKITRKSRKK